MNANNPLTEQEVKQLILTFWKMQEEKAHLVDLMEITAPNLEISVGDFAWHGYKELEDHQMGSKAQFFDYSSFTVDLVNCGEQRRTQKGLSKRISDTS
jgi:hypothetical protein